MSERLTDTESFWNNFQEEFNQWNNALPNRQTTTSTMTTSTSTTLKKPKLPGPDELWPDVGPAGYDHTAHDYGYEYLIMYNENVDDNIDSNIGQTCSFRTRSNRLLNSRAMEFCLSKNCSFCDRCEEICEIHMMKPCKNTWSSLIETCCDMCNIHCETKCPILIYVLASILSILAKVRILIMNTVIIIAFRT